MNADIENFLIQNKGFVKNGNIFTKTKKQVVGETILNGQTYKQVQDITYQIEYIGDGWIGENETNNTPLEGYKLFINGQDIGDTWVRDLDDYKKFF